MKVTFVIGTVKQDLAPGQVLGDWRFAVVNAEGAPVETKDLPDRTAVFDLPPGDYSATAQRFDTTGAAFGSTASATVTVPPLPIEQGDAAATLTVTLS